MNIPLSVGARNVEQELDSTGAMVGVYERDLAAVDDDGFTERQRDYERGRDAEDLGEEKRGGVGAEDNAFGPIGGEAGVVIGVEVGEEVGEGEIGIGEAEGVDKETGVGDEFGVRERGGNERKRELLWWGLESSVEELDRV